MLNGSINRSFFSEKDERLLWQLSRRVGCYSLTRLLFLSLFVSIAPFFSHFSAFLQLIWVSGLFRFLFKLFSDSGPPPERAPNRRAGNNLTTAADTSFENCDLTWWFSASGYFEQISVEFQKVREKKPNFVQSESSCLARVKVDCWITFTVLIDVNKTFYL